MQPNPPHLPSQVVRGARQQQAAVTHAAATDQRAARWLLGRIKDNSQRFLLMQQSPSMAPCLTGASLQYPEKATGNVSANSGRGAACHGTAQQAAEGSKCTRPPTLSDHLHQPNKSSFSSQHAVRPAAAPSGAPYARTSNCGIQRGNGTTSNLSRADGREPRNPNMPSQRMVTNVPCRLPGSCLSGGAHKAGVPLQTHQPSLARSQALSIVNDHHHQGQCEASRSETKKSDPRKNAGVFLRAALPPHWQHQQQRQQQQHDGSMLAPAVVQERAVPVQQQALSPPNASRGNSAPQGSLHAVPGIPRIPTGAILRASTPMVGIPIRLKGRRAPPGDAEEEQPHQCDSDACVTGTNELLRPITRASGGQWHHVDQHPPQQVTAVPHGTTLLPLRGHSLPKSEDLNCGTPMPTHQKGEALVSTVPSPPACLYAKRDAYTIAGVKVPPIEALFGNLSAEQRQVVEAPAGCSICVLAGPGAGKTATITARIVRLLISGQRPLAALTFTKKGATELERRIHGSLHGALATTSFAASGTLSSVGDIEERGLFVGTFHSFFIRLLRSHGSLVGVPKNFRVIGQFQQLTLFRNLIEREKRAQALRRGPVSKGISAILRSNPQDPHVSSDENAEDSEDERKVTDFLFGGDGGSGFSSTNREAEELRRRIRSMKFIPELLQRERAAGSVLYHLFCEYNRHLRDQQPPLLDFTDLTVLALRLLEREETRAQLRSLWPYLVVDEFQDTNTNQFRFLSLLALRKARHATSATSSDGNCKSQLQGGITVVGDDDQSIYKWRGTHTGIFHEFRRTFPDYREFFLTCNYRSVPVVVQHSLSLINFNWPFRIVKALHSVHGPTKPRRHQGFHIGNLPAVDAVPRDMREPPPPEGDVRAAFLPSPSLEAQYILRYILCLKQQHNLRWDDFAILCRTNSALADLQRLLTDPRIQRAACTTSAPFAANSADGSANLDAADPNAPLDPVALFPSVNMHLMELPTDGLPVASTTSKNSGGAEIFLRPDAVDLLSYLRLAVDPHHDSSFIRVLNRPSRRVGAKTLLALKRVQKSLANHSNDGVDMPRGNLEMPWQELPWGEQRRRPDASAKPSLFDIMCGMLRASEVSPNIVDTGFSDHSAVQVEAARLRFSQLKSLASFATAISGLCSMSRTSASVPEVLEYILGPLRLGKFFAERRKLQHARADASRGKVSDGATNLVTNKERECCNSSATGAVQDIPTEPSGPTKQRCKRKAENSDGRETALKARGTYEEPAASLQDLSKVYGSEAFADVLGLLRSVESYVPSLRQNTAADCILRLLRDAGSGRFVQQKVNNAVTLSTIHQAKGLEWPAVIIARANEGTLPMGMGGSQPLADFVARVLSCFVGKRPTADAVGRAETTIMRQASGNEQYFRLMEERRVCYVAITRAKQFLLLTAPLADRSNHPLQPSRFFQEANLVKQRSALVPAASDAAVQCNRNSSLAEAQTPATDESAGAASEQLHETL